MCRWVDVARVTVAWQARCQFFACDCVAAVTQQDDKLLPPWTRASIPRIVELKSSKTLCSELSCLGKCVLFSGLLLDWSLFIFIFFLCYLQFLPMVSSVVHQPHFSPITAQIFTSFPITERQNTTLCIPTKFLLMNKLQGYITEKVVSLSGLKFSIIQLAFDECLIVLSAFGKITMSDIILD